MKRDQALQILKDLSPRLREYGVRDVALFGSVARDKARDASDIDILVDFEPEAETFDNLVRIADLLEASFDSKVDLVTVNGLSPYVAPHIQAEAVHAATA